MLEDLLYLALVYVVAFLGGWFRALANGEGKSRKEFLIVAGLGGCLGVAVVGMMKGGGYFTPPEAGFWLGMSMFVGLLGKEALIVLRKVAFKKVGIDDE